MKPTPELIEQWSNEAEAFAEQLSPGEYHPGKHSLYDRKLCELAAQWGYEQAQQTTDAARVLEWMRTPNRKPANLAFTEGPERQAAYWVEIGQQEMQAHYAAGVRAGMGQQSQDAKLNYAPLYEYAQANRINYNQLCAVLREAMQGGQQP